MTAAELVGKWFQVSRRYRTVARLPDGMTGIEALIEAQAQSEYPHPDYEKWAKGMGEGSAGDHFLRCYAKKQELWMELGRRTFEAYRKAGGETYAVAFYRRQRENNVHDSNKRQGSRTV
jgi:hypothetical protein